MRVIVSAKKKTPEVAKLEAILNKQGHQITAFAFEDEPVTLSSVDLMGGAITGASQAHDIYRVLTNSDVFICLSGADRWTAFLLGLSLSRPTILVCEPDTQPGMWHGLADFMVTSIEDAADAVECIPSPDFSRNNSIGLMKHVRNLLQSCKDNLFSTRMVDPELGEIGVFVQRSGASLVDQLDLLREKLRDTQAFVQRKDFIASFYMRRYATAERARLAFLSRLSALRSCIEQEERSESPAEEKLARIYQASLSASTQPFVIVPVCSLKKGEQIPDKVFEYAGDTDECVLAVVDGRLELRSVDEFKNIEAAPTTN